MSKDHNDLESRLERLPWKRSKFDVRSLWVPWDEIPPPLKEALEHLKERHYGENYVYYLSRSGSIIKYLLPGKTFSDSAAGAGPAAVKSMVGTKAEGSLCPECGEPLDAKHRGQHSHS